MIPVKTYSYESLSSTQGKAREMLEAFDPNGLTVIAAGSQTQGRGREGRTFVSPRGGLYMTAAFTYPGPLRDIGPIALVAGLSCCTVHKRMRLKWPNDLLIDGYKVGGILIETAYVKGKRWVMMGIGMNIATPMGRLTNINQPVTTLKGSGLDPVDVREQITAVLQESVECYSREGFAPFHAQYEALSAYEEGDRIRVRGLGLVTYRGLSACGALRVEEKGALIELESAEILFPQMEGET
jgi:BirA family biotin operon repressor/biotin-[acetyl-CoA-carboxylase] ligase